ncbi:selenocysteine-specific translation elongation factor [Fictibacillus barbaricus]|uniref:Selenocysteine-specific elongation factor n=1 Tax=Fictibacillus barbaricus TaxID=182136 RepID=A0ABS2ZBV8_9BACL|nr:selenocysteine-specific translation elongation factor [Fictibacillus barbaricus]MBN3545695.1 selenocysteine-specific translation elongation factor [Fictibacillus barbaricus]GGB55390.1 selenocysteine-specific translation elongation factor [Fictibacillus barbaricus]
MTVKYYTIGMAGHIDHGKTTLTKALSGIDTDTLKEEKARKITIEPGFAPFPLTDEIHTSIVDVPGHEKLIRQMIAGVAGIDIVLFVIAADEGVMPQTREHFEILSFLGIDKGIIVVTKSDLIDDEMKLLVEEEILELTKSSAFETFPVHFVDSISMSGIGQLKTVIGSLLQDTQVRSSYGPFRMPIDHIFTVKGHGTVIRGTVYEGEVHEGDDLVIQPGNEKVKIRKMQVHKQDVHQAKAGQRAAINISGGSRTDLKRGHVLLSPDVYSETNTVDIVLSTGNGWSGKLKQRSPVKFYTGTSEVMGKIVFFDRNELEKDIDDIFCQVRLDEEIVTKRGDRFIIRRPSPEETIGGGKVIDPNASTYRFGMKTVDILRSKYEGTPHERVLQTLEKEGSLTESEVARSTGIDDQSLQEVLTELLSTGSIHHIQGLYCADSAVRYLKSELLARLHTFHNDFPLRQGIPKAEIVQMFKAKLPQKAVNGFIEQWEKENDISLTDQFVHLLDFIPRFPEKWEKRMSRVLHLLEDMKLEPDDMLNIFKGQQIPEDLYSDFKYFLIKTKKAVLLFDEVLLSQNVFETAVDCLRRKTNEGFTVQEAKAALDTSRKFLIPILECMDAKGYTVRDSNLRKWV